MATPRIPEDDRKRFDRETDDDGRRQLLEEKPFDFIEKTDPADRLEQGGQQTRDNVNPTIPSAEPGTGEIVDPASLGMEQATGTGSTQEAPPLPEMHPDAAATRYMSPNERWGSNIGAGSETGGPPALAPLDLTGLNPDHGTVGAPVICAVHGTGFTPESVVIIDDEEVAATFVNDGKFTVDMPPAEEAGTVDVEVSRGEEFSDVLTFEWLAAEGGARKSEKAERKPKKAEPPSKREKKNKAKGSKK